MNPDPHLSIEDHFTSLMAACDDALAADATGLGECDLPPELRVRLERDLACVKLLQQLRPTQEPGVASDSRSMQPRDDQAQSQTPSDANTVTLPRFPPFQKLGRFEIRRELGRGGFGIVYLAYDPHLRREVALKIPRADVLVNPEARARFQQEARAAAGLDHPNLVPVYDTGAVLAGRKVPNANHALRPPGGHARTGRPVRELPAPTWPIESVAFNPDRRHLASGSMEGTVRIWELPVFIGGV